MIKEKYISRIKETSINVVQTKIDSVRNKDIEKVSFRVYDKGFIGYTGALGRYDESELEKRAIDGLNNKISYEYPLEKNNTMGEDLSSEIINRDNLIDEFEELLARIRKEQPDFYFSNKLYLTDQEIKMTNSNNLDLYYKDSFISLGLIFKEKTSVNIIDGFVGFQGRRYDRELAIEYINSICNAYLHKVDLPNNNKLPVVFASDEMLPFLKFIQDLDGNNFGTKSSLLSDKIGDRVFNENFTLYQTNNPKNYPIPFFDAEGVVNKDYQYALIENGIVKSPYTDKRTADKYDLPLTGAAKAEYDGIPTLGTPVMAIKESEKTAKELLNGEMGIFIMVASGGDFTPEGNFASPVQLAFLFDGEHFIGRLPEINISSNLFDMFGDSFIGVSKDAITPLSNSKYLIINMEVSKN